MTKEDSHPYLILFALWLLVFSASSQIMIISPMLPQIGRELNVPEAMQGTLVSVYALMVGTFALVIGPISDKIGRRRVLLIGAGLMTLALAMHGIASSYLSLLLVRTFAGVAGGVLSGSAVSYVGDYFPYEQRGWASGWIMSSTALGQIAGVPLGTLLAAKYGFRTPFLGFGVTMALTFLLIWQFVPQPDVQRAKGKLSLGSALKSYAVLLRRSDVVVASVAFCLMYLGLALYVVFLPTWLARTKGATAGQIATLFLVGGIANALTGPLAGRLSDRVGRKSLIIASCLGLAAVMLSTTFVIRKFWMAYPLFFFTMILVAARISPFQALLSALVKDDHRGTLLSLTVALGQVGFALGGALAGPAYSRFGYASNSITGAAFVLLMALLVWRFLPEPKPELIVSSPENEKNPVSAVAAGSHL
ncbi:MAG: MFS transporter [Pyrinomonadaceae bacterium]|nr:MFS transporter [Pyrinomonadaceae bacterium]